MDSWREWLYYPIGLLPSIFFTLRFVIQWIQSERKKESHVTPLFWRLSLAGNCLLWLHYTIQIQFPFALIQAGNGVISWRNLNLMGGDSKRRSTQSVIWLFSIISLLVVAIFAIQGYALSNEAAWLRLPTHLGGTHPKLTHPWLWHTIGVFGGLLFASRFWIQWWQAETEQKSTLGSLFWWLSIAGSILMLAYFIRIHDIISTINYSFALIPYVRNLMLLNRKMVRAN